MSRHDRPRHRTFGRLNLEGLEAREVPAAYFWCPSANSDLLSTTASNWLMGPGTPAAPHTTAPGWQDDLYFQGDVTQAWCTPETGTPTNPYGVAFNGIHLLFGDPPEPEPGPPGSPPPPPDPAEGYWGTVTLADSFAVRNLEIDCGYVRQADPTTLSLSADAHAGTLTVQSALDWTGGTLNSNTVAGFIDLAPGSISTAEPSFTNPDINGTVYLGSTLTLKAPDPNDPLPNLDSVFDHYEGTYEIKNVANFVVEDHSRLQIKAPVPKPTHTSARVIYNADPYTHVAETKGIVEIEGGTVEIECEEQPRTTNLPARVQFKAKKPKIVNESGLLIIRDKSEVIFTPNEGDGDGAGIRHTGFLDPTTRIEAGSKVKCEQKTNVRIDAGALELTALNDEAGVPVLNQPEVVISAPDAEFALDIWSELRRAEGRTVTLTLNVDGVFRAFGRLGFWADRTRADSDQIVVKKETVLDDDTWIDAEWFTSNGVSVSAPAKWVLVKVTSQLPGEKIITPGLPKIDGPVQGADFVPTLYLSGGDRELGMERKSG